MGTVLLARGGLIMQVSKLRKFLCSKSVKFDEKSNVLNLLTILRNSIKQPNLRLSSIMTNFLGKSFWILITPKHKLFSAISSFVLLKPSLDVRDVPEFYKCFHSCSVENFQSERIWILQMIKDGLREWFDFKILQRRYVFKLLLSFYGCKAICDAQSSELILKIVLAACQIKQSISELCFEHNLFAWISTNAEILFAEKPGKMEYISNFNLFLDILTVSKVTLQDRSEKAWNAAKMGWLACCCKMIKISPEKYRKSQAYIDLKADILSDGDVESCYMIKSFIDSC